MEGKKLILSVLATILVAVLLSIVNFALGGGIFEVVGGLWGFVVICFGSGFMIGEYLGED